MGLDVHEGEAEPVPAPEGAGAADAVEELLAVGSRLIGFRIVIVLALGLCKKFSELIATDPKVGSGSIT